MRVRDLCTRGIAGVGAPKAAVGARSNATSSASLSSSSSKICDTLATDEATDAEFFRPRRARGDGEPREELPGEGLGVPGLAMSCTERALPNGPLMSEPFGVEVDGV